VIQFQLFRGHNEEQTAANFTDFINCPKVHTEVWKKIIQNPEVCNLNSKAFREKLPLESEEITQDSNQESGLYCLHQLKVLRVFICCVISVGAGFATALYLATTIDVATGFTVRAFILAVPSLFLAVLAFVLAASRRSERLM
jgi:hypothetical protein